MKNISGFVGNGASAAKTPSRLCLMKATTKVCEQWVWLCTIKPFYKNREVARFAPQARFADPWITMTGILKTVLSKERVGVHKTPLPRSFYGSAAGAGWEASHGTRY